jgi:hypothetical protein
MKITSIILSLFLISGCQVRSKTPTYWFDERDNKIRDLFHDIKEERKLGPYGTGLAYRYTDGFLQLKEICTAEELKVIETILGPPIKARPDYRKSKHPKWWLR